MATIFSPSNILSYPFLRDGNTEVVSPLSFGSTWTPVSPAGATTSTAAGSSLFLIPQSMPFATLVTPTQSPTQTAVDAPGRSVTPLYFSVVPHYPGGMPFNVPPVKEPFMLSTLSPVTSTSTSLHSFAKLAIEEGEAKTDEKNVKLPTSGVVLDQQKIAKKRAVRPPPLDVAVRNLITKASVHLSLSASKLCKFRKYTMELTMKRSVRLSADLTEAIIFTAMLNAKCCKDGSDVAVSCSRCGCQRVVNVTATAQWPSYNETTDEETYTCTVQSKCSSSRDHLKSLLVLRIDSLPPILGDIVSEPFVLLARDKGKGKRQLAAERALLAGESPKKRKKLSEEQASEALCELQHSPVSPLPPSSSVSLLSDLAKVGADAADEEKRINESSVESSPVSVLPVQVVPQVARVEPVVSPALLEALVASSENDIDDDDDDDDDNSSNDDAPPKVESENKDESSISPLVSDQSSSN